MLVQKGVNGLLTIGLASFQRTQGLIKDFAINLKLTIFFQCLFETKISCLNKLSKICIEDVTSLHGDREFQHIH